MKLNILCSDCHFDSVSDGTNSDFFKGYVTIFSASLSHVNHVVPDIVAESLTAIHGLAGALASHRPLAGCHPFHRPRVGWGGGGQGEGGVLRRPRWPHRR